MPTCREGGQMFKYGGQWIMIWKDWMYIATEMKNTGWVWNQVAEAL